MASAVVVPGGVCGASKALGRSAWRRGWRRATRRADECLAGPAVGSERFDLPTGKVERPHVQRTELFVIWVVADECFQLANDCLCRTLFDVGCDPLAERR